MIELASTQPDARRSPPPSPRRSRGWSAQQQCDGSLGGDSGTRERERHGSRGAGPWATRPASRQGSDRGLRATRRTNEDPRNAGHGHRRHRLRRRRLAAGRDRRASTSGSSDQWRRATAQAVSVLRGFLHGDRDPAIDVTGPSGYLKAGSSCLTFESPAPQPATVLCLSRPAHRSGGDRSGHRGPAHRHAPAGTATRSVHGRTTPSVTRASRSVKVLGAKTLTVSGPRSTA